MKLFIASLLPLVNAWDNIDNFSVSSDRSFYIVDGDSISLQMRLAGIDTPEIKQNCQQYN